MVDYITNFVEEVKVFHMETEFESRYKAFKELLEEYEANSICIEDNEVKFIDEYGIVFNSVNLDEVKQVYEHIFLKEII